jgi:hypothetical protein
MRRALGVACVCVCLALMCIFVSSCGQTYELQSITVSPSSPNLEGIGATQALAVTAHFSNSKTEDVTPHSQFVLGASADTPPNGSGLAPLSALTLSTGGVLEVVQTACTWHATPTGATFAYGTNPYLVTISYTNNGITKTTQAFISVDNATDCYDGQTYPAPAGFAGN